jgi:hypothetical protein
VYAAFQVRVGFGLGFTYHFLSHWTHSNLGTLQIRRLSDGDKVGYLGTRVNRENAYTVRPRLGAALRLAVPPITSFGVAINLIAANAPDSGHPYLGAVDAGQGNLGSGEAG